MEEKKSIGEEVSWYSKQRSLYVKLAKKVESIIEEIIGDNKIPIHVINSRAKEVDSFEKKIKNSKYTNPRLQITDLAGIRVITYVESDLERVSEVIKGNFEIDDKNSIDKSKALGEDKVGYRSIHYVAKFPKDRVQFPEYRKFEDKYFEIQIRTILQHAWAEIEHDKDYKFSGVLPPELKRRFKLLAGSLELADREFNNIAAEIDEYGASVRDSAKKGDLEIEIDSTSLQSYMKIKFNKLIERKWLVPEFSEPPGNKVIKELNDFDIKNLKQLDKIVLKEYIKKAAKHKTLEEPYNYEGILRDVMLIKDANKYFQKSWHRNWTFDDKDSVEFLKQFNPEIETVFGKYGIDVV